MKLKIIIALAVLSSSAISANAQTSPAARPVSTIKNDQRRVHQGVKSGELTRKEAARLKVQEARLAQERRNYKQDGISAAERADLRKDKKRVSKSIYRQKHDNQTRP